MSDVTPLLDDGDVPEFPDYEVVDSSELDALDRMSDEEAIAVANEIRTSRARYCFRCPHAVKAGVVVSGTPARYVLTGENGDVRGVCKRHGKNLVRRLKPPTMTVPKGRR